MSYVEKSINKSDLKAYKSFDLNTNSVLIGSPSPYKNQDSKPSPQTQSHMKLNATSLEPVHRSQNFKSPLALNNASPVHNRNLASNLLPQPISPRNNPTGRKGMDFDHSHHDKIRDRQNNNYNNINISGRIISSEFEVNNKKNAVTENSQSPPRIHAAMSYGASTDVTVPVVPKRHR
eukprot:CAMPEP_0116888044 /NCGR_PEP_ID=MMETSP0463-20121206/22836_1 /TAXON_ID=181622 /ORGANISM="Strombidinopsis sp, Strain SopsisLIS2011" /LENGTH=176 /DNA_ID=CAMNT_0004551955 /DNA_START=193 /DNA_END=723 /DNA_ORIENTATION=-